MSLLWSEQQKSGSVWSSLSHVVYDSQFSSVIINKVGKCIMLFSVFV